MPSSVVLLHHYYEAGATLRMVYTSGIIYDGIDLLFKVYEEMKMAFSKGIF